MGWSIYLSVFSAIACAKIHPPPFQRVRCHFREGLSEWVMKHQGALFQYWGSGGAAELELPPPHPPLFVWCGLTSLPRMDLERKRLFGKWSYEVTPVAEEREGEKKKPTEVTPIARRHWYLSDGTNWICLPSAACWSSKQRISGSTYQSCQSKSVWLRTWETQTSRGVGAHEAR